MQRNNTLALFLPLPTPFYLGLYNSLKRAFEQHNFTVVGGCELLNENELLTFIEKYKPSIFFEMNRCRDEITYLPNEIIHICWLVDLAGRSLQEIQGSQWVCFFSIEWLKDYVSNSNTVSLWLPPASDEKLYYSTSEIKLYTSSFLGHIPKPWSKELRDRVVYTSKTKKIIFDDILKKFEDKWAKQDAIVNNDRYIKEISDWLHVEEKELFTSDTALRYDAGCRIIRKARRTLFLDYLLSHVDIKPLAIFGTNNWLLHQKYKHFYLKELDSPAQMNTAYNQSKTIIHEGVGLHFRVFDAMLAGTPVILRKSEQDYKEGGLSSFFIEGEDYIGVDINQDGSIITQQLSKQNLQNISKNAQKKALSHHTWYHRLTPLIEDIHAKR